MYKLCLSFRSAFGAVGSSSKKRHIFCMDDSMQENFNNL